MYFFSYFLLLFTSPVFGYFSMIYQELMKVLGLTVAQMVIETNNHVFLVNGAYMAENTHKTGHHKPQRVAHHRRKHRRDRNIHKINDLSKDVTKAVLGSDAGTTDASTVVYVPEKVTQNPSIPTCDQCGELLDEHWRMFEHLTPMPPAGRFPYSPAASRGP
jgi:hypothetical protein